MKQPLEPTPRGREDKGVPPLRAVLRVVCQDRPGLVADVADEVERRGYRFAHEPIAGGDKAAQERRLLERLAAERVDLVVLARYMQVLSPEFVDAWPERVINIHHSFLPAFAGADPYR